MTSILNNNFLEAARQVSQLIEPGRRAEKFEAAFNAVFNRGCTADVVALSSEVLSRPGGFLCAGHRLETPKEWRKV